MAVREQFLYDVSFIDDTADLQTKQYFIVKQDGTTADGVVLAAAATDPIIGVLQNKPGSSSSSGVGHVVQVRILGISKVQAGGTVAVGDLVTSDANGKAVTTVTSQDLVLGRALSGGAAGQVISILMTGIRPVSTAGK